MLSPYASVCWLPVQQEEALLQGDPCSSVTTPTMSFLPSQDMGVGLAVVPLMGLLETVAIAKAFGMAAPGSCARGGGSLRGAWGAGEGAVPTGAEEWTGLPMGPGPKRGLMGRCQPSPHARQLPPVRGVGWGSPRCAQPEFGKELSIVPRAVPAPGGSWDGVPRLSQALPAPFRARGGLCLWEARGDATHLLSASQNDYRIDPNQELLALGKRLLGAGGGEPAWVPPCVPQPLSYQRSPFQQSSLCLKFYLSYPACCPRAQLSNFQSSLSLAHAAGRTPFQPWVRAGHGGGGNSGTDQAVPPVAAASQPLSFPTAGFANVLGSFVSSYPITGSFGRWVAGWGVEPQPAGRSLGLRGDRALQDLGRKAVWTPVGPGACVLVPSCHPQLLGCAWDLQQPSVLSHCSAVPLQAGSHGLAHVSPHWGLTGWVVFLCGLGGLWAAAGGSCQPCQPQHSPGQHVTLRFRTAVNAQSGVCTPAGGLVTGRAPGPAVGCPAGPRAQHLLPPGTLGVRDPVAQVLAISRRRPGPALAGVPHLALLLHPQSGAGRRHHLGCGPHV